MCLGCVLRCIGHAKAFSVPNPEPLIFENRRHIYVAIFLATQPILRHAAFSFKLCRSVDLGLVKPLEDASVVFFDV